MPAQRPHRFHPKRIAKRLLYGLYLCAVVPGILYPAHLYHMHRLRQAERKPERLAARFLRDGAWHEDVDHHLVGLETMRRVGYLAQDKTSAFLRYPVAKRPGTTRLCAFGDSHTRGDEVGVDLDYPGLLGRRLSEAGTRSVEVLNFGVDAFGFHQTFTLWEALQERYGCDATLLGPSDFHWDRDVTFGHGGARAPYYLHARFVLDGDDVALVELPGDTVEARFRAYHRFIPYWRVLRYDSHPPEPLQAVLPPGRTLANPFYYRRGRLQVEALATYAKLLAKMTAAGKPILLGNYQHAVVALARGLGRANLEAFELTRPARALYVAPRNHSGPLGNAWVADQYLARLLPENPTPQVTIEPADSTGEAAPDARPWQPDLTAYSGIEVEMAGQPVAELRVGRLPGVKAEPVVLKALGATALLVVPGRDGSVVDGCFLPFPHPLEQGTPVVGRAGTATRTIGEVRLLGGYPGLGVLAVKGLSFEGSIGSLGREWIEWRPQGGGALVGPDARWVVAGTEVLTARGSERSTAGALRLRPAGHDCLVIRASAKGFVDVRRLPREGVVWLVLRQAGGRVTRLPLERWRLRTTPALAGKGLLAGIVAASEPADGVTAPAGAASTPRARSTRSRLPRAR